MVRALPVLAVLTVALVACKAPPPKSEQAAASSTPAPASSESSAPAAPAAPSHNWAFQQGQDYAYLSGATPVGEPEQPTLIRYLGQENGVYTVIETQQGQVVGASCSKPCDTVRLRGKGLDQTLALNPTSIVYAALTDAMNGQLDVYKPPAASAPGKAPPP